MLRAVISTCLAVNDVATVAAWAGHWNFWLGATHLIMLPFDLRFPSPNVKAGFKKIDISDGTQDAFFQRRECEKKRFNSSGDRKSAHTTGHVSI